MIGPPTAKALGQASAAVTDPDAATWSSLAAAVGLLTAHISGSKVSRADLAADVTPGSIVTALVILGGATLRHLLDDEGAEFLRGVGLTALSGGGRPDSGTPPDRTTR